LILPVITQSENEVSLTLGTHLVGNEVIGSAKSAAIKKQRIIAVEVLPRFTDSATARVFERKISQPRVCD
jgi:hypothetical protein